MAFKPIAEAMKSPGDLPREPQPGSTTTAGPLTTRGAAEAIPLWARQPRPNELQPLPIADSPCIGQDVRSQETVKALIEQCYATLKLFGKEPETLEPVVALFLMVLEPYPLPMVTAAFLTHLRTKAEVPTPADIVELVDPPEEPLSSSMYIELTRRINTGEVFVSSAERAYVRAFEQRELGKVRS